MAERIIALRPHHIDTLVGYYYNLVYRLFPNMFDNPRALEERYGSEMVNRLRDFYEFIASGGTGEEYILVRSGLDSICDMCPIKEEACSEPDSLSVWNGSGQVMEYLDLREGFLYPINEFLERLNFMMGIEGYVEHLRSGRS